MTKSGPDLLIFCRGVSGGCKFDEDRARGVGDADGASRFRFVAVVGFEVSGFVITVLALDRPFFPDERCCCSESDVVGAGVLGGSAFTFEGLPTRLLGGSGASEVLDIID